MKSLPTLYILADDVTGAADCAARCKQAGLPATILLQPSLEALPTGAISVSSDSRYLTPTQAAESVRRLCSALGRADKRRTDAIWYKKIDSTLRGNIGAEVAAMLSWRDDLAQSSASARPCAVIAPAFPAQSRGLVDGYLVYAQAPAQPQHFPSLLQQQAVLPTAAIDLATVRGGVEHLADRLLQHYNAGAQLLSVDAVTETDLVTLYRATRLALPKALFCGSAGLIGVIATELMDGLTDGPVEELIAEQGEVTSRLPVLPVQIDHPMLAVVGSGSIMAHRQLAQLRRQTKVACYAIDPSQTDQPFAATLLEAQGDLALHLPEPAVGTPLEGELARQWAATLATVACQQIRHRRPRTLLLVGGDTSVHLLKLLGVEMLQVQAELLPGMPLTVGQSAAGERYQIIMKAGNHGDEQTLVTLFSL